MFDVFIIVIFLFSIVSDMKNFEYINWVVLVYGFIYFGFVVFFVCVFDVVGCGDVFVVVFCIFIVFFFGCGFSEIIE